jgi:hypothetical protein
MYTTERPLPLQSLHSRAACPRLLKSSDKLEVEGLLFNELVPWILTNQISNMNLLLCRDPNGLDIVGIASTL